MKLHNNEISAVNPLAIDPEIIKSSFSIKAYESLEEEERNKVFTKVQEYFDYYRKLFCKKCEQEKDGLKGFDPGRNKCLGCFCDILEDKALEHMSINNGI